MKSLYESILSSTKSGKYGDLTIHYLLNKGYDEADDLPLSEKHAFIIHSSEKFGHFHALYMSNNDEFYMAISHRTGRIKYQIKTIYDLETVENYWKFLDKGDKSSMRTYKKQIEKFPML